MSPALEAHLRLLAQLPSRTHTCESAVERGQKYSTNHEKALRDRLKKMEAAGITRREMIAECGTSSKTIVRLLGRVRHA